MLESIKTLNSYGMEITSGIILGLDTETADTEQRLKDFIDLSQIPMLTINLLQALPKTPLWDRLKRDGRLDDDPAREQCPCSCARMTRSWRCGGAAIAYANDPERLFERFRHQVEATYANRKVMPAKGKLTWSIPALRRGDGVARRAAHLGILSDFRKPFWRAASMRSDAARSTPCSAWRSWASPDPVHARGAARRAERVVLLGQTSHGSICGRGARLEPV